MGSLGAISSVFLEKENPVQAETIAGLMKGGVVPPGIEPGTHGFSVRCSTN